MLGVLNFSNAQDLDTVKVKTSEPIYSLDSTLFLSVMGGLSSKDKILENRAVDSVLKEPNNYAPPTLFLLSIVLFSQNKKEKACFWFYVAQLRGRYDVNISLDSSAGRALSMYREIFGLPINTYAFKNINRLKKIVTKVVDFVRANPENYDHSWIYNQGLGPTDSTLSIDKMCKPKSKWAEIKRQTIEDYYNDFLENVVNRKK